MATNRDLLGQRGPEDRIGVDEAEQAGVQRTTDRGQRGADQERDELGPRRVDAARLRRVLVLPDRLELVAEPRARDQAR